MKFLGRMHHKLREYSKDPFKDFTIGNISTHLSENSSLDDRKHTKQSFGSRYDSKALKQSEQEFHTSYSELVNIVEENIGEETSTVLSEIFHGFLTIGTLGYEPNIDWPSAPTFAMSLESITEEKIEVTENDLKLINDKIEKFLEAEAKEEGYDESSGRNSHLSCITISSKQMVGSDIEDYGNLTTCPLQGYLFGSSIELPETIREVKKGKTTLSELFYKTNLTDENYTKKCDRKEMQVKRTHNSAALIIKKMAKKLQGFSKRPHPFSWGDAANSASTKKKLQKVLRMFHRKIHPENSAATREFDTSHTYKNEKTVNPDKDNIGFPQASMSKDGSPWSKTNPDLSQYGIDGSKSNKKEHWINTDSEYLVLEL